MQWNRFFTGLDVWKLIYFSPDILPNETHLYSIKHVKNSTPKEGMHTYPSFNEVLCPDVDYSASNSFGRVEAEGVIFIPLPGIEYSLCVDGAFINCSGDCHIDELTASSDQLIKQNNPNIWYPQNERTEKKFTIEELHPWQSRTDHWWKRPWEYTALKTYLHQGNCWCVQHTMPSRIR